MSLFTVLGACGYIGRRLVTYLQESGHEVWAPERGASDVFSRPLGHVMYCVGLTGNFRSRPFDTVDAHVALLQELLRRAQFDSLLYLSSTRVYMGSDRADEEAPLQVLPADPSYLYNLSKLLGESLCHASGRTGVRVARLSNVVGSGMSSDSGNLIADLVAQARTGHVVLRSALQSAKDYIHVDDVLESITRIALGGAHRTYNLASGVQTTHGQWLQWLAHSTGCSVECLDQAPVQQFPVISVQRLRNEWPEAGRRPVWDRNIINETHCKE